MNLSVVGMSSRDAHVFDLFMQRSLSAWHWVHVAANRDANLGGAKLLVLDLAAHGWAQASQSTLAQLMQLVGDRVAVLLVSGQDRTWTDMAAAQQNSNWIWLTKPYGTERMRETLTRAAALVLASQTKKEQPAKAVLTPVAMQAVSQVGQIQPPQTPRALTLDVHELAIHLADAPPERFTLLRQLVPRLLQMQPFEVRFTVQNSLIVHPQDAWAATNTPVQVIARVCDSAALASAVSIRDMELSEALERVQRLGMPLSELNGFLFDISSTLLAFQATQVPQAGR